MKIINCFLLKKKILSKPDQDFFLLYHKKQLNNFTTINLFSNKNLQKLATNAFKAQGWDLQILQFATKTRSTLGRNFLSA